MNLVNINDNMFDDYVSVKKVYLYLLKLYVLKNLIMLYDKVLFKEFKLFLWLKYMYWLGEIYIFK